MHYFKFLIRDLEAKGHHFYITARDKEVVHSLLDAFNIKYTGRGKGASSLAGKILYLIRADLFLLSRAIKFKPDLFLSFASPYAAHVSRLLGKPHIALTDTENAPLGILSFAPFTKHILTPVSFEKDFGKKHIRFNSFMELSYLHPDHFKPDSSLLKKYGLTKAFVIIRFVSWDANHDIKQTGFRAEDKIRLVRFLEKTHRVIISSESALPGELEKYRAMIRPEDIHSLLYHADLYIGEGATMASEAAMLGTPAIYVNTLTAGTIKEQGKAGLVFRLTDYNAIEGKIIEINPELPTGKFKKLRDKLLIDKINLSKYLTNFVEGYPGSIKQL